MSHIEWTARLVTILAWNERDVRKILRTVADTSLVTGLTEQEIVDFIQYGFDDEISELKETYDWTRFKGQLVGKLSKRNLEPPGLSVLHPDLIEEEY
ncbi:hypothetical protein LEP1GSC058_2238 [Leptospira fainei serovar Hurstbridge str. BUT 6]|uniref:Uncharacterized protein n=1 Tax=Leptospira fainei serovar Hurstbridge str. BUT 6 TaxID=1193011 RepID=S3V4R2_9LEPT|nr:hypothetical protein [Leptospira fainei]EPG75579.1 hypothetical protein LEP1GSC058_2238 [Leptospira fainei serovar Hurstbridge str. BUT 6]